MRKSLLLNCLLDGEVYVCAAAEFSTTGRSRTAAVADYGADDGGQVRRAVDGQLIKIKTLNA
jgi:hypothetical protein